MDSLLPLEGLASRPKLKATPTDAKPSDDRGGEAFEAALADASEETQKAEPVALTKDAETLTDSPKVSVPGDATEANALLNLDTDAPSEPHQIADAKLTVHDVDAPVVPKQEAPLSAELAATETPPPVRDVAIADAATADSKPQPLAADIVARADAIETANADRQTLAETDATPKAAPEPQSVAAPDAAARDARIEPIGREPVPAPSGSDIELVQRNAEALVETPSRTSEVDTVSAKDAPPVQRTAVEAEPDTAPKTDTSLAPEGKERAAPTTALADAPEVQAQTDPRVQNAAADPAPESLPKNGVDADGKVLTDAQLAADAQLSKQNATLATATPNAELGRSVELATAAVQTVSSTAAPAVASTIATPQGMQAQQAILVASPSDIPDIVSRVQAGGSEDGDQRVLVRLDPPELGKVSIDFKFDAQGLQHVTITAETPEAIKRLREMHFELVQGLEQNGLSGQDMTFRQETPNQANLSQWADVDADEPGPVSGDADIRLAMETLSGTTGHRDASGRLNIRL